MDLTLRSLGIAIPKGHIVRKINGNKLDLTCENLTLQKASINKNKNSWLTHYLINIRLKAVLAGKCPDAEIARMIELHKASEVTDNE